MSKAILRSGPLAGVAALALALSASGGAQPAPVPSETVPVCGGGCFADPRDGRTYPVVSVGGVRWFSRNLAFPSAASGCGDVDSATCERDGRFYPWGDAKGACPPGWRLPTDSDWSALSARLGGDDSAGGRLKARVGWNQGGGGSDSVGFGARPVGIRYSYGIWDGLGGHAFFWTSTAGPRGRSWYRSLDAAYRDLNRSHMDTLNGLSVRCVEETSTSAGSPRDSRAIEAELR